MYDFIAFDDTQLSFKLLLQKIQNEIADDITDLVGQQRKFQNAFKELMPNTPEEVERIRVYYRIKINRMGLNQEENYIAWFIVHAAEEKFKELNLIKFGGTPTPPSEETIQFAQKLEEKDKNTRVFYELNILCEHYRQRFEKPLLRRLKLKNTSELDNYLQSIDIATAPSDLRKYSIVKDLQQSVKTEDTPQNRINAFSTIVEENGDFLSKHRDSRLTRFFKGVVVALSLIPTTIFMVPAAVFDICAALGGHDLSTFSLSEKNLSIPVNTANLFNVKGEQFTREAKKMLKDIHTESSPDAPSENKPK